MKDTKQQFEHVISICRDVFSKKLHDYGAAWRIMRPSSITDQIFIKANRIRSLEVKGVSMINEGIRPEFIGIVNYGIIGLIQLELGYAEKEDINEQQALEALERVGLKDRAHHLPSQLSGGEQQRVCIARALINCPKIILADEPTGNLDEKNEKIVLDLFRQLHEQGTTIIVVTHDALVASCAQREIMLNHGVLVGEKWNDEEARKAYEAAGGKPAFTGSVAEGAQHGETAIDFADPTKSAKTGGSEA